MGVALITSDIATIYMNTLREKSFDVMWLYETYECFTRGPAPLANNVYKIWKSQYYFGIWRS